VNDRWHQNRSEASGKSAMRLRGLMRKEFLQIFRDPSSISQYYSLYKFLSKQAIGLLWGWWRYFYK
jgi:hypothetical protein